MANTGKKVYVTLLKVTNDINEYPVDINGNLCSISGLPQATKSNTIGQPDYIAPVTDLITCPIPTTTTTTTAAPSAIPTYIDIYSYDLPAFTSSSSFYIYDTTALEYIYSQEIFSGSSAFNYYNTTQFIPGHNYTFNFYRNNGNDTESYINGNIYNDSYSVSIYDEVTNLEALLILYLNIPSGYNVSEPLYIYASSDTVSGPAGPSS